MISLTVDLRVRAGHLEPFLAAITENADRSFHDEPGCVHFDVSQDTTDEHHFIFYELYLDQAAVEAHREAPHFTAWRAAAAEHVEPGSQVNVLSNRLLHHSEESS
jgi:autoinducer 2-degrading protein